VLRLGFGTGMWHVFICGPVICASDAIERAPRGALGVRVSTPGIQRRMANWRLAGGGVPPAGKLLTALLGKRLRRSQLAAALAARCARDVLADHSHNLDIIYYIASHRARSASVLYTTSTSTELPLCDPPPLYNLRLYMA
jgi:hypothetical protein